DTNWQILAFRMLPKNTPIDEPYGLQFYTVDASGPLDWAVGWVPVGDVIDVGVMPTGAMTLAAGGVVTRLTGSLKQLEIDFIGVGGRGRR
ncbi:MAG: hypothetical protein ACPG77_10590, partial [Nannocystaceae bacterium]